jgi:tRNA nucleotidyltransferase (CCA-adding enzyme)
MKLEIQTALEWLLALETEGYEAALVGGAVRDLFLGLPVTDVDISTSAPLEVVLRLWPGAKPVGKPPLQTALLQCGKVPVEFCSYCGFSLDHDLARRDFTVNAMAMTRLGTLVDPRGGEKDLTRRRLRFNGRASDRLQEDAVRAIRLFRFAATLPLFTVAPDSESACRDPELYRRLARVPGERIGREIMKALEGDIGLFLDMLNGTGLLGAILPEIEALKGIEQDPEKHPEGDAYLHTRLCLDTAQKLTPDPAVRAAALLHDVAKAQSAPGEGEESRFTGHERDGAELARDMARRWAWPQDFSETVANLVRWHRLPSAAWPEAGLAQQIRAFGGAWLERLFVLGYADVLAGSGRLMPWMENRARAIAALFRLEQAGHLLDGREVMEILDLPEGPQVGEILARLDEAVIRGEISTPAEARSWLTRKRF